MVVRLSCRTVDKQTLSLHQAQRAHSKDADDCLQMGLNGETQTFDVWRIRTSIEKTWQCPNRPWLQGIKIRRVEPPVFSCGTTSA